MAVLLALVWPAQARAEGEIGLAQGSVAFMRSDVAGGATGAGGALRLQISVVDALRNEAKRFRVGDLAAIGIGFGHDSDDGFPGWAMLRAELGLQGVYRISPARDVAFRLEWMLDLDDARPTTARRIDLLVVGVDARQGRFRAGVAAGWPGYGRTRYARAGVRARTWRNLGVDGAVEWTWGENTSTRVIIGVSVEI